MHVPFEAILKIGHNGVNKQEPPFDDGLDMARP
jgi:hypothetical protein